MRSISPSLVLLALCFLAGVFAAATKTAPLQCHQGNFALKDTGTEVTPCTSSSAKSCMVVYNKSKKSLVQSCSTSYCSPNSKVEPVSVCRLTSSGITCCCHGYGCNKRKLVTVLPPSYWK